MRRELAQLKVYHAVLGPLRFWLIMVATVLITFSLAGLQIWLSDRDSNASSYVLDTPPFGNLVCTSDARDFTLIQERAAEFAKRHQLGHYSNEFSTAVTTSRLNLILTYDPDAPIFATGIARTEATKSERALFDQFVASLPLRCSPV